MITNSSLCGVIVLSAVLALLDHGDTESTGAASPPAGAETRTPEPIPLLRWKHIPNPEP